MKNLSQIRARLARRLVENPEQGLTDAFRKGLTLVELSIVILILGVLMTVLFANLDFEGTMDKTTVFQVRSMAPQLESQWRMYERENEILEEGTAMTVLVEEKFIKKEEMTIDPFNNPYFICLDENGDRQICSLGEDGQEGGEGKAADFYLTDEASWPKWLAKKKKGDDDEE